MIEQTVKTNSYENLDFHVIENKYCRLANLIAKDFISQYKESLIEFTNTLEECGIKKRLLEQIKLVDGILNNFEINVFCGKLDDNYLAYFDLSDRNFGKERPVQLFGNNNSKEILERNVTRHGIGKISRTLLLPIGINDSLIEYSMKDLSYGNDDFNEEKYLTTYLLFNSLLSGNLNKDGIRLEDSEYRCILERVDNQFFKVDLTRSNKLIKDFINYEIEVNGIENTEDCNKVARDVYSNLLFILPHNYSSRINRFMVEPENYAPFGEAGKVKKYTIVQ